MARKDLPREVRATGPWWVSVRQQGEILGRSMHTFWFPVGISSLTFHKTNPSFLSLKMSFHPQFISSFPLPSPVITLCFQLAKQQNTVVILHTFSSFISFGQTLTFLDSVKKCYFIFFPLPCLPTSFSQAFSSCLETSVASKLISMPLVVLF